MYATQHCRVQLHTDVHTNGVCVAFHGIWPFCGAYQCIGMVLAEDYHSEGHEGNDKQGQQQPAGWQQGLVASFNEVGCNKKRVLLAWKLQNSGHHH